MSYTISNLRDVKDEAAEFGMGEIQESRFPRADVGAEQTGLAYHRIKPGQRTPFAHQHDQAEEVHVVLSGSGRAILDDEVVDLRALDVLRVAPEVTRTFEAGSDGLEYLVFGPRHEGDGRVIRDG
jgi:uncharacterized cupin superfamily protein